MKTKKKWKLVKKLAKKRGYKLVNIKLTKRKPKDVAGFPILSDFYRPGGHEALMFFDELRGFKH